jgi:hypothetical protein
VAFGAPSAHAIPAFARKYGTSCQTCHVAFPKLTPFGEAFRRNGYRFPAGEEEDASNDEPVLLGQKAHKKVFPNAVWPGQVPGMSIAAVQMGSTVAYAPEADPEISFASVGANLGVNFAGTFGDSFSGWAGAGIRADASGAGEAELERVFVFIKPLDGAAVNLRVGRFEPTVSSVTIHRTLGFSPWFLTTSIGDNAFTLDPTQVGFEAKGVVAAGRLDYAAGVVEGAGNELNNAKDVYGRVSYKIGGMRYDGIGGATDPQPWRETSLQIGGFGYYGQATLGDPAVAKQTDKFFVAGGDLTVTWRDLSIYGVFTYGNNKRPSLMDPEDHADTWQAFGQVDYVVYPWLIPTARYERRSVGGATSDRISGGVYALVTANVRLLALGAVEGVEGHYDFSRAIGGLNVAF